VSEKDQILQKLSTENEALKAGNEELKELRIKIKETDR
jgi:hypothetical protein